MLESTSDESTQSMFYNGYKCDHFITNLFLFTPDGKIAASYFNAPGSIHDSTMAKMLGIYKKIDCVYQETGGRVVADSAFQSHSSVPSLIGSKQRRINAQGLPTHASQTARDATSVRQLSEWGMRGLQGSFPKLKDRIP